MRTTFFINSSRSVLSILFSSLIGSAILCAFSVLQKMSIGAPLVMQGFIVPLLFGGISGMLLGILIRKYRVAAKNLRLLNAELEDKVVKRSSELHAASEQQKQNAVFFQSSLDGLLSNIAILDTYGKIILVNKSWRDFAENNGASAGAVSEGVNYLEYCDMAEGPFSEEAVEFAEGIRQVLAGKESSVTIEYPCHSPDKKRWFIGRISVIPMTGSDEPHAVISHEDITERKLMEQSVTSEKNRLADVSYGTRAGSWEWNIQTGETVFDERWAEIIGYKLEEISPVSIETWSHFIHPDDLKESDKLQKKHFNGEKNGVTS